MKHVSRSLQSWWYTTMAPARTPLTTISQRENMRKRRLFSLMLLIALVVCLGYIASAGIFTALAHQIPMYGLEVSFIVLALWLNRQGHLNLASVIFYFCYGLTTLMAAQTTSITDPLYLLWTCFLMTTFLVSLGFFVSPWIIFPSAVIENLLFFWYLLIVNRVPISLRLSPTEFQHALLYLFILIYASAFLGIFFAVATKRAVVQADRAVELEQAHQIISKAFTSLEVAHTRIQKQAVTDGLTDLPNHGAIIKRIEAELLHCRSSQNNCAIVFVDIDHFKHINDTWGHAAGDAALYEVGQRLRKGVRKDDCVGRYGGEEFAILLSNIEQSEAFDLAERLRCSIAEIPCLWQRAETQLVIRIPLTASFGLAAYPLDGLVARELLDMADAAMYTAKHTGRNRVCLPDEMEVSTLNGEKNNQLPQYSEQNILQTISTMAEFHDQETQAHANRMIGLAEATIRAMGRSEDEVVLLRLAVQLHDIGKIGIPETILHKPGPLTEDEWGLMRHHPQIGQQILTQAKGQFGLVSHIVVAHHERWDGKGYPYRLAQQEIPLGARILSVIDAYDAMTSSRPYRAALSAEVAQQELQHCAGTQFDPQVVDAFLQVLLAQQAQEPKVSIFPASASV
nr:diguanylate cyclase [Ktedonobacteraceae bacterium]